MTIPGFQNNFLLDFRHVSVSRGDRMALSDVSIKVPLGQHVAILGPNGSGKSTLIKTITRECYPLAGRDSRARVMGRDMWNVFELRKHLGIVSSDIIPREAASRARRSCCPAFSTFSLWRNSEIRPEMTKQASAALNTMGAGTLANRPFSELSSGEARRVAIARALAHRPHSLLLDEPMSSLDIKASGILKEILSNLAETGRQIIMVTHDIADILPGIRRVIMLKKGRIVADGDRNDLLTEKQLSALFETGLKVVENGGACIPFERVPISRSI